MVHPVHAQLFLHAKAWTPNCQKMSFSRHITRPQLYNAMNIHIRLLLLPIFSIALLQAKLGCMDTSYHLTTCFDRKLPHYVNCACPCDQFGTYKQVPGRGQVCTKCGHSHAPLSYIIVNGPSNA